MSTLPTHQAASTEKTNTSEKIDPTEKEVITEKINTSEQIDTTKKAATNEQTSNIEQIANNEQTESNEQVTSTKKTPIIENDTSTGNTFKTVRKRMIDEKMINTILHERNVNGLFHREIAAIVGTSLSTVSRILIKHHPGTKKTRKPYKKGKPVDEKMINAILHERNVNGLLHREIAAIVGTSRATVYIILRILRECRSSGFIKDIETRSIVVKEEEVEKLEVESHSTPDTKETQHEGEQFTCTLDPQDEAN